MPVRGVARALVSWISPAGRAGQGSVHRLQGVHPGVPGGDPRLRGNRPWTLECMGCMSCVSGVSVEDCLTVTRRGRQAGRRISSRWSASARSSLFWGVARVATTAGYVPADQAGRGVPAGERAFCTHKVLRFINTATNQRAIPEGAAPPGLTLRLRRLGGDSVRGSPCGEPARLRFTSLRPPSCGDSAGPSCCVRLPCCPSRYVTVFMMRRNAGLWAVAGVRGGFHISYLADRIYGYANRKPGGHAFIQENRIRVARPDVRGPLPGRDHLQIGILRRRTGSRRSSIELILLELKNAGMLSAGAQGRGRYLLARRQFRSGSSGSSKCSRDRWRRGIGERFRHDGEGGLLPAVSRLVESVRGNGGGLLAIDPRRPRPGREDDATPTATQRNMIVFHPDHFFRNRVPTAPRGRSITGPPPGSLLGRPPLGRRGLQRLLHLPREREIRDLSHRRVVLLLEIIRAACILPQAKVGPFILVDLPVRVVNFRAGASRRTHSRTVNAEGCFQ